MFQVDEDGEQLAYGCHGISGCFSAHFTLGRNGVPVFTL